MKNKRHLGCHGPSKEWRIRRRLKKKKPKWVKRKGFPEWLFCSKCSKAWTKPEVPMCCPNCGVKMIEREE